MSRLTDEELSARIVSDPAICGGELCVRGTRIPIWIVLGALADGLTHALVIDHYPSLTEADIMAVLLYAAKVTMPTDTMRPGAKES